MTFVDLSAVYTSRAIDDFIIAAEDVSTQALAFTRRSLGEAVTCESVANTQLGIATRLTASQRIVGCRCWKLNGITLLL